MATASELAQFCVPEQPVTLIYIRGRGFGGSGSQAATKSDNRDIDDLLRRRVIDLAARLGSDVELVEIDPHEISPELVPTAGPLLLVMRQGELYCQAAGPLPSSELARMVGKALRR